MNVDSERVSILKKGSRTGYLAEPQSDKCSRMCGMPVLSRGVVRSAVLTEQKELYIAKHANHPMKLNLVYS